MPSIASWHASDTAQPLTPICGSSHPKLKPSLSRRSGEQREVNSRQRVTNNGGGVQSLAPPQYRENMKTNRLSTWETLIVVVAVALLGYFLTSCSPRVLPIENTRTEWRDRIEWRDRLRIDSIYIHDSVYVSERKAGDTIYKDKIVYRNRERVVHDTINEGSVDSVRVVQTITRHVEVPAKLTAWQSMRLKAFAPLLAIALALGAWVSRKLWLPLLRGLIG